MKPRKYIYQIGIVLSLVATAWLMYNFVAISIIKPVALRFEPLEAVYYFGVFLWLGLMYFFLYHIGGIVILLMQVRRFKDNYRLRFATIILGSISLMMLLGDAAMLSDIGKESQMGWDTSTEWTILQFLHGIHGSFILLVLYLTVKAYRHLQTEKSDREIGKDEIVFTTTQYVGILCGIMGLYSVIMPVMHYRSFELMKIVIL